MAKKKETEFDKLARLIKGESEDIREQMDAMEKRLDKRIDELEKKWNLVLRSSTAGLIRSSKCSSMNMQAESKNWKQQFSSSSYQL